MRKLDIREIQNLLSAENIFIEDGVYHFYNFNSESREYEDCPAIVIANKLYSHFEVVCCGEKFESPYANTTAYNVIPSGNNVIIWKDAILNRLVNKETVTLYYHFDNSPLSVKMEVKIVEFNFNNFNHHVNNIPSGTTLDDYIQEYCQNVIENSFYSEQLLLKFVK